MCDFDFQQCLELGRQVAREHIEQAFYDPGLAEDAAQQGVIEAYNLGAKAFNDCNHVIHTVQQRAHWRALDEIGQHELPVGAVVEDLAAVESADSGFDEWLQQHEANQGILDCINALSTDQRTILILRLQDVTGEETARALNLTRNQVNYRFSNAREHLKSCFDEKGVTRDDFRRFLYWRNVDPGMWDFPVGNEE